MVKLGEPDRSRVESEASAWLARIQGQKCEASEKGLQDWLRADPAHREAFERATEIWDLLPGVARPFGLRVAANDRKARRHRIAAIAAIFLATLGLGAASLAWLTARPTFTTRVGQQQITALEDGTSVALNTDSKVTVLYSPNERRVRLDRGEALFDVTHNPSRPFIVTAGNEEVRALGTSFVVRRDKGRIAVTLVRGRVEITRHDGERVVRQAMLAPGERATIEPVGAPEIDHPSVDTVTAWRRGEVVFDDVRLADAIAELNRYGGVRLIASEPAVANIRVSGVFATNDAREFANAVAQLNRLRIVQTADTIVLSQ